MYQSASSLASSNAALPNLALRRQVHVTSQPFLLQRYIGVAATVEYINSRPGLNQSEKIQMVARVSIIDYRGNALLDTYVHPTHYIQGFKTRKTGPDHVHIMHVAPHFQQVQSRVADMIKGKIIVGHSLWIFLSILGLPHPALYTRDLALFRPFRKKLKSRFIVGLSTLVDLFMGRKIGLEYENPLEISRASMDLFRSCHDIFEQTILDGGWPCNLPPLLYADYFT